MRYRPSLREGIRVGLRCACLGLLLHAVCEAQDDRVPPAPPRPVPPRPALSGGLVPPPPMLVAPKPCVCTSWNGRIADIERRHEENGRRDAVFAGRFLRVGLMPPGPEYRAEIASLKKHLAESKDLLAKLRRDNDALEAEIASHAQQFGYGVRHSLLGPQPQGR
jgi:hypothetical protein